MTLRFVLGFHSFFYLVRVDMAYAFVQYWLKAGYYGRSLPYSIERSSRYQDIFNEDINSEDLLLSYFVALAFIKMRTIASQNAVSRSRAFASSTPVSNVSRKFENLCKKCL